MRLHHLPLLLISLTLLGLLPSPAEAIPAFARQYQLSCAACHAAFPRLNAFGERFAESNYRLDGWQNSTLDTGDDKLALPKHTPVAFRAQAFTQWRDARAIDPVTGQQEQAKTDIQAPYLIKLLASAPLSDHLTYYFYGIFAEKGGNGSLIIEDAWINHDNLFGTGTALMLGQFQVSDLMFARETRLTFQDFMAYRLSGLTYDRGLLLSRTLGPLALSLGLTNGNGIEEHKRITAPGLDRPDRMFDNDSGKAVFAHVGTDIGPVTTGVLAYRGQQKNATGQAGVEQGDRDSDKNALGLDLSGMLGDDTYWFAQAIANQWRGFIDAGSNYRWYAGFIGIDYVHNPYWTYSLLYNYADAGGLDNTDTVYEGIDVNSLTLTTSYYFMRNAKALLEINVDLLAKEAKRGQYYTGHLSKENYVLLGFDTAF